MFTTLPLELFVCREVIEQFFFSHEPFSMNRHVFFTSVILFSAMSRMFPATFLSVLSVDMLSVSLITCDLGVMLEITGGASATALAFIFPAACYLKLVDPSTPWYSRTKIGPIVCTVFGLIVMTISMVLALNKVWTPEGDVKICS
jgi:solute carrier family 38 (sodium-coupled neutral amino acid transporter), member 11